MDVFAGYLRDTFELAQPNQLSEHLIMDSKLGEYIRVTMESGQLH